MTKERGALELALELEPFVHGLGKAILRELKEALAQPDATLISEGTMPEQCLPSYSATEKFELLQRAKRNTSRGWLYCPSTSANATPQKREWVGLTGQEKYDYRYSHMTTADLIDAIEAKLKELNHG